MLTAIEKAINLALMQMEQLPELDSLENKTLAVHIEPINFVVYITLHDRAIRLTRDCSEEPVTTVRGYPSSFISYLINKEKQLPKAIKVEGDINALMQLNKIIQNFDLDWEEILSKFIGDPATHIVSKNLKQFKNWLQDSTQSVKHNTSEYLVDEIKVTPSAFELNEFNQSVDELRDRVARLEKHIEGSNAI